MINDLSFGPKLRSLPCNLVIGAPTLETLETWGLKLDLKEERVVFII